MNSYFDQQWDQQLAGRPVALAAFTRLSPAAQERIVGYVQSCDDTWEANRRIRRAAAGGRHRRPARGIKILPQGNALPCGSFLFTGGLPAYSHR